MAQVLIDTRNTGQSVGLQKLTNKLHCYLCTACACRAFMSMFSSVQYWCNTSLSGKVNGGA